MRRLFKRPHIIICIGDDNVVVTPHDIDDATAMVVPLDKRKSLALVAAYVDKYPLARVSLLIDNLAQDYRLDTLPSLHWFDRRKLALRRLRQNFPSSSLTGFRFLKRATDKLLFVGLHDSNPAFLWAERLSGRLPQIVLLPLMGAGLAHKLGLPNNGWHMTISRNATGGFRQIVTCDGEFIFTRLTPLPTDNLIDEAEIIARDLRASLDYLKRQGLQQAKDLSVLLLMDEELATAPTLMAIGVKSLAARSPIAVATQLFGLPPFQVNGFAADYLYAKMTAHAFRLPLALRTKEVAPMWRDYLYRLWGFRIAVPCLAIALIATLWNAGGLIGNVVDTQSEATLLTSAQQRLALLQQSAVPLTEPLGRLRQAIERRRLFEQPTLAPWALLNDLDAAFGPDARVHRFEWEHTADNAPDSLKLQYHLTTSPSAERADIVDAYSNQARKIAAASPLYTTSITRTPYPDLPRDSVSASPVVDEPIGEVVLRRKEP